VIDVREIRHFHLFGAIGGGADGFNKGEARIGNMVAKFRCIGSVDVDAAANRDFERRIGVKATTLDLFDRSQYVDFNGKEPPADWREATPADIRAAAGHEFPHIVFLSAPCKGFSGLLSENRSRTDKYQALNRLTLRGVWLMLEAFGDSPPELIIFENVPRIASRGRHLLDQIGALLRQYGYAVAETTHDCGELGGLAQSRKRFLLVARHIEKVPPFLYEPQKKSLRSVGEVIGRLPLPGDPAGGVMHRVPALQWKTWVRLAFVEAGSDWRSLNRLAVVDGALSDYLIVPEFRGGYLGVNSWEDHTGTVAGRSTPSNGSFSVADPRFPAGGEYGQLGVRAWDESTGTVTGQRSPIQGGFSVADPRTGIKHNNCFRVVRFDHAAGTITGGAGPSAGGQAVADPRRVGPTYGKYGVTGWGESSGTVISGSTTGQGAYAVADPRPGLDRSKGDHYLTGGHYGVVPWDTSAGAVSSSACHDNGRWSVADPRASGFSTGNEGLPSAEERLVARIIAEDGTWHRPFTTLELASLQGLVDPEEQFELDGLSDSAWRERIGNAVPPPAAAAIASEMGRTLLLAWSGETFALGCTPIWVRPVAVALSVAQGGAA
jgi:site-specific DNA-cytosine methylase